MTSMLCIAVYLAVAIAVGTDAFTPFQIVDDYVKDFEHDMEVLKKTPHFEEPPLVTFKDSKAKLHVDEYDFIIVGAGASGSAIANRLSEIPEWKILLLEAGKAEYDVAKVPAMQQYLRTTSLNWQYKTVPQNTSCLGTENQQCAVGRGKALGGDTVTNDMLYTRGHPKDYDTWADNDLIGWCWQSILPYFKKIEDACAEGLDRKYHRYGGPIHFENFKYSTHLAHEILKAAEELGIPKIDYNGKEHLGLGLPQVTTEYGKRRSAAASYLEAVSKRKNLVIKSESRVIEISIGEHTKEAKGVTYYRQGQFFVAKANKEVILAAGAINTAQLLLMSGIGPEEELKALEIPLVADLKVGHNLKDHVSFIGLNFLVNESKNHEDGKCQNDAVDYLKYETGPLTTTGLELVGFLQTEFSKIQTKYPDVQILVKRNPHDLGLLLRSHNLRQDIYDAVWAPLKDHNTFSIEVVLLHPKSTGYVKLHGEQSLWQPIINPNSLSDEDDEDVETLLAGINKVLKLVETETLKKQGIQLHVPKLPDCDLEKINDDFWRCAIRYLSVSTRDFSGTAKMGTEADSHAVVDHNLRIYGVHNLRVADSSVIPVSISGNLMAANMVIGEKAADLIKNDWSMGGCQS